MTERQADAWGCGVASGQEGGLACAEVLGEVLLPAVRLPEDMLAQRNAGHGGALAPPPGLEYLQRPLVPRNAAAVDGAAPRAKAPDVGVARGRGAPGEEESSSSPWGGSHAGTEHELLLSKDDIQVCTTQDGKRCRLGEGGFGVVYKALMNGVDEVAMKLVKVRRKGALRLEARLLMLSPCFR